MNYARRQQYRRLSRAGRAAAGSVAAALLALLALVFAGAGPALLAGLLLLTACGSALYARHWLVLAGRSRVGARSEDDVQRALASLQVEGWRLRHSLPWQGGGDIDSVAISPTGIAVAIETKTRTYDGRHLARVCEQRRGFHVAGENGPGTAPMASCASFVRGASSASSASSTTFWWFRSTA